jgi:hypothetical protein
MTLNQNAPPDFMITLARKYEGIELLDSIHRETYPEKAEMKTDRFDQTIAHAAMYLLTKSDKYGRLVFMVKVPEELRSRVTIASDGTDGEKISLMHSCVPVIRHPVTMSQDDVKAFIAKALADFKRARTTPPNKLERKTSEDQPESPFAQPNIRRLNGIRAISQLGLLESYCDINRGIVVPPNQPCPVPQPTPVTDMTLFSLYAD